LGIRRHLLLVGLSGAGKTTVGRLAAATLGAPFVDLDEEIVRHAGRPITVLFQERGEVAFRALESACARDALAGPPAVVAAGAGCFDDPANRLAAHVGALTVYLKVDPAVASARLGGSGGRPLLETGEPVRRLTALLARRRAGYLTAEHIVATDDATPEGVAQRVVSLAREHGGW
jgi:shikimate kinase/3-dehydroquinate synthase